jgi:lambda repressor-like predicted transcriptional regulator
MATKAQIAKTQAALAKSQADLAKAAKNVATPAASTTKSLTPDWLSVVVPGYSTASAPETQFIYNTMGEAVEIYTTGPLSGRGVDTGDVVIQGQKPLDVMSQRGFFGQNIRDVSLPKPVVTTPAPETPAGNTPTPVPDTNSTVLKAQLKALGFSSSFIDGATSYLSSILRELDGDYDNATEVFLNTKEYTTKAGVKLESPFYKEYGYLNESLTVPKSATEIYNSVEGYKEIASRYGLDKKFISQESIKGYVTNNVSVKELDERANMARLKSINADPVYVDTLQKLGYIGSSTDLTDFFLDPKIGQQKLEQNRNTAAFAAEAIRRAKTGVQFDKARFEKISAELASKGLTEAQISQTAGQGFETISQTLQPLTKLEQIYGVGIDQAKIQADLEAEQFQGTESQLRARRKQQEELAFQRKSGTIGASRGSGGSLGTRSTLGTI